MGPVLDGRAEPDPIWNQTLQWGVQLDKRQAGEENGLKFVIPEVPAGLPVLSTGNPVPFSAAAIGPALWPVRHNATSCFSGSSTM